MQHTDPAPAPAPEPAPGPVDVSSGDGTGSLSTDPAEGLAVLHVVVRACATNSQYNEHCLPVRASRRITVCSLFPADVTAPEEIRLVEGDGSVRGCFRALREALAIATYDVVHVHAPASGVLTMLVYLRSRRSRRDLVFTVHSSWPVFRRRNRLFLMAIAAFFPVLVVCGQAAAESLPRRVRILARRIEVVSNGVDIDRVDRVLADRTGLPPRRRKVGRQVTSVIRTRPIKDPGTLVEAFMGAARPRDSLVLVGVPALPGELSSRIHEADMDGRIRLSGVVPRDEVYRIFHSSRLFVSTSKGEGLPVSVLEAMACRCPVVLSDIPPHRDIARLAPDIPLIPVGDVAGFRDAIARMLRMPQSQLEVVGQRLRRCAAVHFSVTAMNEAYGRIYRDVAQRNRARTAPAAARRIRPRVVAWLIIAAVLGALAALEYGATHRPGYQAATTLAVGDVSLPPAEHETGPDATDAATVADLVRRQVVLQPVAQALGLGDWRAFQRRVHSAVGDNPRYVEVTVTATNAQAAERLASAVGDRVVQLTSEDAGPAPDPGFADRELSRLTVDIATTQARIDHVLQRMSSSGPPAAGSLGRRLAILRARLAQLQDSYQRMLAWHGESVRSRGVTVSDVAYAQRSPGPPETPMLAALGAAGGLGALLGLRLLVGGGRSSARDAEPEEAALSPEESGDLAGDPALSPGADADWRAERVGSSQ